MNTIKLTKTEKFTACINIICGRPVMTNVHCHVGGETAFLHGGENKGGVFIKNYIESKKEK